MYENTKIGDRYKLDYRCTYIPMRLKVGHVQEDVQFYINLILI